MITPGGNEGGSQSSVINLEELYFSGNDQVADIGGVYLRHLQYIAITPQQNITPVYNVFNTTPQLILKGNFIVRGTIGFNMQLAEFWDALAKQGIVTKWSEQIIYAPHLNIRVGKFSESANAFVIRHLELEKVYMTGAAISMAPEGNPVQEVYSFIAYNLKKSDEFVEPSQVVETIKDQYGFEKLTRKIPSGKTNNS